MIKIRGAACVVAVAAMLLAGCGQSRPEATASPGVSDPAGTAAPVETVTASTPGFDPDDPVGVVLAMLDQVRRSGSGRVVQTVSLSHEGVLQESLAVTVYDARAGRSLMETTVDLGDGDVLALRMGYIGDAVVMEAPEPWGMPAGTWFRLDEALAAEPVNPLEGRLAPHDDLPSPFLAALADVRTPAWVAEGDATSSTVRYELVAPERTGWAMLPNAAVLMPEFEERYPYLFDVLPVSVEVRQDASLVEARIDIREVLSSVALLEGYELPWDLEAEVTVSVYDLGEPVDIELPELDDVLPGSEMPGPVPDMVLV